MIAALTVALTGVLTISQTGDNAREVATARISVLINDQTFCSAAYDTRVKMALELTDELAAAGLIRGVYYDAHAKMITFEFADGTLGGIGLKSFSTPDGYLPMN